MEKTGKLGSDTESALKQFFDEVINVTGWMLNFLNHCLIIVPQKLSWDMDQIKETVEIKNPPNPDDIFLPPFIKQAPNKPS